MAPPIKPQSRLLPSPPLSIREPPLPQISGTLAPNASDANEPYRPHTTSVTATVTTSLALPSTLTPTSILDSQNTHLLHSTKTPSGYNVTLPTTSAYQTPWWPQIGTVVNEMDIPEAWRPKQMQREELSFWQFMGFSYGFLAVVILGVWMISWSK